MTDMAMPNEIRLRIAAAYFLVRACVCLLGLGAIAWGGFVFPLFWQQATLNRVASQLLQGQTFKRQALLDEALKADTDERSSFCNPTQLHNLVILRLVLLDDAIAAKNQTLIDSAYAPLYDATRRALACAPADPFTWLTLFSLDAGKHGFDRYNAAYLRLSYVLGPNEGWIALWRSRLAFAMFERLPDDLSDDAIDDFIKLVDTGKLYPETAAIFASAAPAVQSRIVAHLDTAKVIPRQTFAKTLYDNGLDVIIPSVGTSDARPWR
jgi:hypothetical protein